MKKVLVTATSFLDELQTHPADEETGLRILEELDVELEYRCDRDPSVPMTVKELTGVSFVIADLERYDAELFSGIGSPATPLELVVRYGVGYESVDVEAARAAGVAVANTPGANSLPTAEWALATLLAIAGRRMPHHERAATGLGKSGPSRLDVSGRILGIIGTGRVGKALVGLMMGFGMTVLAYDPFPDYQWAKTTSGLGRSGAGLSIPTVAPVSYVPFERLLRESDFISLHPSAPGQIIGADELRLMKRTAVLVNCARRRHVDSRAVYDAVRTGALFGYGLDDPWPEADLPLSGLNIVVSPHVGSDTDTGKVNMRRQSALAVAEFIRTGTTAAIL